MSVWAVCRLVKQSWEIIFHMCKLFVADWRRAAVDASCREVRERWSEEQWPWRQRIWKNPIKAPPSIAPLHPIKTSIYVGSTGASSISSTPIDRPATLSGKRLSRSQISLKKKRLPVKAPSRQTLLGICKYLVTGGIAGGVILLFG
ncbi:hypothetical protein E3N88_09099 [Mikania micrantha]|uniref:Uncharacterized protein n=1 Tax=Mikania micrantha TaxID=192012 RepID=A0A5N6PKE9_9ASTR|nr:hypothetical protein E3N88_09099 [Mikania micrantha]